MPHCLALQLICFPICIPVYHNSSQGCSFSLKLTIIYDPVFHRGKNCLEKQKTFIPEFSKELRGDITQLLPKVLLLNFEKPQ